MVTLTPSMKNYLRDIKIPIRIGCIDGNGLPRVVSMWFLYKDGVLYCATSKFAKIVSWLEVHSKCGFEVAPDNPPYCGVRGTGSVEILDDPDKAMLKEIYLKYCKDTPNQFQNFLFSGGRIEVVLKITIERTMMWNFTRRMEEAEYNMAEINCP